MSVIGIPALYYFHYYPLWKTYFEGLGFRWSFRPQLTKKPWIVGFPLAWTGCAYPLRR